jgi:hypothetical protein
MALMSPADDIVGSGVVDTALVERIRHWTRERLLKVAGQHHAGTGRARLYNEDAVYDASVLHVLTGAGFNVGSLRYLAASLTAVRRELPKWKAEGGPLYLKIARDGADSKVEIVRETPSLVSDLTIVVDLARLWSRIGGAP